ncbi:hypothetical protein C0995_011191 [Termitomyces sp. Mi166|nr:hypothetical protein C0995_011191 [Termitomyces sp. Mi166\
MDKTVQYLTDVSPYPSRKLIEILFPTTVESIVDTSKKFVADNPVAPGKKTVVIIDAIVSNPRVKFPWKELVAVCKQARYWSVVDAAHSVGQETNINLSVVQPDFWVSVRLFHGNLIMMPYGTLLLERLQMVDSQTLCYVLIRPKAVSTLKVLSALAHVHKFRNQYIIKSSVPTSGSYVSPPEQSFFGSISVYGLYLYLKLCKTNMNSQGTASLIMQTTLVSRQVRLFWRYQKPSLFTTAKALEFRRWLGGEEKISAYCHDIAVKDGKRLAEIFNTEVMDPDGSFTWNMVNVELPGVDGVGPSSTISRKFTEKLLREHNASGMRFFQLDDFEKIGQIWLQVIKEVLHELIPEKRRDLVGYSTTSDFYRDL